MASSIEFQLKCVLSMNFIPFNISCIKNKKLSIKMTVDDKI